MRTAQLDLLLALRDFDDALADRLGAAFVILKAADLLK